MTPVGGGGTACFCEAVLLPRSAVAGGGGGVIVCGAETPLDGDEQKKQHVAPNKKIVRFCKTVAVCAHRADLSRFCIHWAESVSRIGGPSPVRACVCP